MNNWHPSVTPFIEQNNYQQVIETYEKIIENNPDEITNYWYLGLAYLFNQQETEAQTIWFLPFSEADEQQTEIWTEELTNILMAEADYQENQKNYDLVWFIGQTIKEINPHNITNLLSLLKLSIIIDKYESSFIQEWGILDLLTEENKNRIDDTLLLETLEKILYIPNVMSIEFSIKCLNYTNNDLMFIDKIRMAAYSMGLENLYIFYSIDLLKSTLDCVPEHLDLYKDLHHFYSKIHDFKLAIDMAKKILDKSQDTVNQIIGHTLLFHSYASVGNWKEISNIQEQQQKNWEQLITESSKINDNFFKQGLTTFLIDSLYLCDNLAYHRYIFNGISKRFLHDNYPNNTETKKYPNSPEKRPLKIGYIGHTFRRHSVGYLCRWLINHHDSEQFETYVYSVQGHEDDFMEQWFKSAVKNFCQGNRNVKQMISQIEEDQIDILIDVDSVTSNITNLVLCQKPAPIQVTWLGLDASGLPTIDYYIADPYVLPDHAQQYYQEKIWRLPHTYLAIDGFEMATPTRRREDFGLSNDDVIFMNLQNPAKLNPDILKSQLKIVNAVANGYLFTKIRKDEEALKELVTEIAKSENISLDKLRFIPSDSSVETHRANLQIADVILDTYPYNGSTTTLEALWAEIPVVTRVGEQFAARNSYTYMVNAGITEGIAWSDEEYIEWGIKFGTDENLRKEVSWKLRQSKKTSPLWNGKKFAREMEKAYQQMWEIYCSQ